MYLLDIGEVRKEDIVALGGETIIPVFGDGNKTAKTEWSVGQVQRTRVYVQKVRQDPSQALVWFQSCP